MRHRREDPGRLRAAEAPAHDPGPRGGRHGGSLGRGRDGTGRGPAGGGVSHRGLRRVLLLPKGPAPALPETLRVGPRRRRRFRRVRAGARANRPPGRHPRHRRSAVRPGRDDRADLLLHLGRRTMLHQGRRYGAHRRLRAVGPDAHAGVQSRRGARDRRRYRRDAAGEGRRNRRGDRAESVEGGPGRGSGDWRCRRC